ncbi:hypothetical protein [uncultured Shewanella sp.]|uniref:hypothetical protein n=1 Tax=uncultured Shewanella sp. TaxID=173975 RepID=UPI00261B36D0|nr:hypothetical protein [uncultured Shewanella sp.]
MKINIKGQLLLLTLTGCIVSCDSNTNNSAANHPQNQPALVEIEQNTGRWIYGDMHIHSTASDGHNLITTVLDRGFNDFGSSFLINTDHSGFNAYKLNDSLFRITRTDEEIINLKDDIEPHSHDYAKQVYPNDKALTERSKIINTQYTHIEKYRDTLLKGQYLFQGMEWTIPYTNEHATLLILDNGEQEALIDFHNRYAKGNAFDNEKTLEYSLQAVIELDNNFNDQAFYIFNHPSRKHKVTIEDIRHFHNAAPHTFIGMEGAPGHQRDVQARGKYAQNAPITLTDYNDYGIAYHGRTYGGFDYMTARLGGVWDALLSEGRQFSILSSSDFHSLYNDFWPNEYAKTYYFLEEESAAGIISAIKSGNSFVVHGDLISSLDFNASTSGMTATMGEQLNITKNQEITVTINTTIPAFNHHKDAPDLAFIDVIAGTTSTLKNIHDSDFNKPFADNTYIIKSFTKGDNHWINNNGEIALSFTFTAPETGMYLRLRGSNHPKGTPGFVDKQGNPIVDTAKTGFTNTEEMAWSDLWFYSNPIYLTQ